MSPPPRVCLLTRHAKGPAVAPALAAVGFALETIDGFDTDTLGTFSGEVERQGSMRDAALAKARLACELGGCRYGLGSEGSFGGDPFLGMSGWGRELLVWWDAEAGYAVEGFAQGPETNWRALEVADVDAARRFADAVGFPGHGILVGRPGEAWFDKACDTLDTLVARVEQGLAAGAGPVALQTDMRAHRNPTRMRMISRAASALSSRLSTPCPACAAPGFGPVAPVPGAPCEACGAPTHVPRAERRACPRCGHEQLHALAHRAPPERCDQCNP
ncbi:MAG: hypothetical protein FGM40_06555 [Rhodocyclaceae bacterium]|nr:hypothetical protein [Rhodocyclaceae bacterium]